ncbi:MAG: MBL fold metallo-hydrolase [Candidatus Methanomethylophilaceae archaeon]|jgi:N-acyl homoserine lactone hydrolase
MIRTDILAVGQISRNRDGSVISADSTSTLIRTGSGTMVVDTGTRRFRQEILDSFGKLNLSPQDVDMVFLTHTHYDHTENMDLYPDAEVLFFEGEIPIEGAERVSEEFSPFPGVMIVHTPGHTPGSASVFVDGARKYAVAGDAIPTESNFRKMKPPRLNCDPEAALQSIIRIGEYADVVVPGHGPPFDTRV